MIVNAEKSKISKPLGIKFLGYGFWYSKGGKIKPKPHLKSVQKFKRKIKRLTCRKWSINLDERIRKLNQLVRGWVNYYRIANMKNVLNENQGNYLEAMEEDTDTLLGIGKA